MLFLYEKTVELTPFTIKFCIVVHSYMQRYNQNMCRTTRIMLKLSSRQLKSTAISHLLNKCILSNLMQLINCSISEQFFNNWLQSLQFIGQRNLFQIGTNYRQPKLRQTTSNCNLVVRGTVTNLFSFWTMVASINLERLTHWTPPHEMCVPWWHVLVVHMWYPCGVHLIPMWCACDTHVVYMWYPCGVRVTPVCTICNLPFLCLAGDEVTLAFSCRQSAGVRKSRLDHRNAIYRPSCKRRRRNWCEGIWESTERAWWKHSMCAPYLGKSEGNHGNLAWDYT